MEDCDLLYPPKLYIHFLVFLTLFSLFYQLINRVISTITACLQPVLSPTNCQMSIWALTDVRDLDVCSLSVCSYVCECLRVCHRAISHMMKSHSRAFPCGPPPTLFLPRLSLPSYLPYSTSQFLTWPFRQPSGLSPLHQSSHYLSFSVTSSDWLTISPWHFNVLISPSLFLFSFTHNATVFIAYSLSLHFCPSSLISYLPLNPYSHLLTVCWSGSLSNTFFLCCCHRQWIVLCFIPFYYSYIQW